MDSPFPILIYQRVTASSGVILLESMLVSMVDSGVILLMLIFYSQYYHCYFNSNIVMFLTG